MSETQSSSGVIVSTGFGSTGWYKSVLAGAMGVMGLISHSQQEGFGWGEKRLAFAVREPFPSMVTGADIVFGDISKNLSLTIESLMPEGGVIFSDGLEDDYLQFNSGVIVSVSVSAITGQLII